MNELTKASVFFAVISNCLTSAVAQNYTSGNDWGESTSFQSQPSSFRSQPFRTSPNSFQSNSLQVQVEQLEQTVFGKANQNLSLVNRVVDLEKRVLGKPQSNGSMPLSARVQYLQQAVGGGGSPAVEAAPVTRPTSSYLPEIANQPPESQGLKPFESRPFDNGANSAPRTAQPTAPQPSFRIHRPSQPSETPTASIASAFSDSGSAPNMMSNPQDFRFNQTPQQSLPQYSGQRVPHAHFFDSDEKGLPASLQAHVNLDQEEQSWSNLPAINHGILNYVMQSFGRQIGDGECWTLAQQAMIYAGARPPHGYTFGHRLRPGEDWLPGDIIQFTSCVFHMNFPGGSTTIEAGSPNHTAIMFCKQDGRAVVAQQNYMNVKRVGLMVVDLNSLVKGKFQIFRAD